MDTGYGGFGKDGLTSGEQALIQSDKGGERRRKPERGISFEFK